MRIRANRRRCPLDPRQPRQYRSIGSTGRRSEPITVHDSGPPVADTTRCTLTAPLHARHPEEVPKARAAAAQTPLGYASLRLTAAHPDIDDIPHIPNVSTRSDGSNQTRTTSTTHPVGP
jgi:hypothetical protein